MSGDGHGRAEPQEVAAIGLLVLAAVRDDSDTADRQHGLWRTGWLRTHHRSPSGSGPQPPSCVSLVSQPTRGLLPRGPDADMCGLCRYPCLLGGSLHRGALVGSGSQQPCCELLLPHHPNLRNSCAASASASTCPPTSLKNFRLRKEKTVAVHSDNTGPCHRSANAAIVTRQRKPISEALHWYP